MPYKDLQKRKEYHKLYMLEYEKKPERKEYLRKWHLDNKERRNKKAKEWYSKNKDVHQKNGKKWIKKNIDRVRQYRKDYAENNRLKINKYHRDRIRDNVRLKIETNIGRLLNFSIKEKKLRKSLTEVMNYSIDDLIKHLESQFDNKTTWDNYGSYWHIDHIKPRNLFKYKTTRDKEFKECWALENLRPLERIANLSRPKNGSDILLLRGGKILLN